MEALYQLTLTETVARLKKGAIALPEVLASYLAVIAENKRNAEKAINATLYVDQAAALEQAKQYSKKWQKTLQTSLLAGAPIAIKRNINLAGFPVDCCSAILENYTAAYTATLLDKLLQHGGTVFANLNMDEFAMGSANENSIYGRVRNPINRDYIPGGSSGGPAAAVAAGEAVAALGSDTGGSVRQPAACCGVVGMKPTYGRVSRYGVVAFASSFDQVGPITRSVADNALLLTAIAGHDKRDSTSVDVAVADYTAKLEKSLKGLTIGLPEEYFLADEVEAEILTALGAVREFFASCGVRFKKISLPTTPYGLPIYYVLAPAEASTNLARFDGVRYGRRYKSAKTIHEFFAQTRSEGFGPEVRRRMFTGSYVLSAGYYDAYYLKALKVRRLLYNEYLAAIKTCDAFLMPTMPYKVFKTGAKHKNPVQMYLSDVFTIAANLTGLPAISVPCGRDEAGLPISFQLLGRPFQEEVLYNLAHVYEKEHPFKRNIEIARGRETK